MSEAAQPSSSPEVGGQANDFDRWVSLDGESSAFEAAERLQRTRYNQARHAINIRVFDRAGAVSSPRWVVPATVVDEDGSQVRGIRLISGSANPRFMANDQVHCIDRRYMD